MSRDGSGNFTRSVTPPVNGGVTNADDFNSEMNDVATALSDSINKSGTKAFTANQPMGSFKLTGLAAGTTAGDSVRYEQLTGLAYQASDATLTAFAGLTTADNRMLDFTGVDTMAVVTYATVLTNINPVVTLTGDVTGSGLGSFATTIAAGIVTFAKIAAAAIATAAEYRANTASNLLDTAGVWAGAVPVALTDAATIAVDTSTFLNATVTLAGNRTLGQPTNTKPGHSFVIEIRQDATGSRTLAYHADWLFAGGTDPVLSTAANAMDALFCYVRADGKVLASLSKAFA